MSSFQLWASLIVAPVIAATASATGNAAPPAPAGIAAIGLSKPFDTRSRWEFTATQAPPIADPFGSGDDTVPGVVHICVRSHASDACDAHLQAGLGAEPRDDLFSEPHFLNKAEIIYPHGPSSRPLLLVQTAGLHSGDGDQAVFTQVLEYERASDRFVRVYDHRTGTNNNQEVRYIASGRLQGDIIAVEPTENAPYGFWVAVNALTPAYTYKEILRYRSATAYGDGNPLAVIDSEMPNIQRRLGLWRPRSPLPLPATPCPRPRVTRLELWCD